MPEPQAGAKDRYLPQLNRATEHLANERTFLAWIRTSIAVVSFGFVTGKLSVMLPSWGGQPTVTMDVANAVGINCVLMGIACVVGESPERFC